MFIKKLETFSATSYKDAVGYPTIGYGHRILEGEDFDHPLSKVEATDLLHQDINDRVQAGLDMIKPDLSQNEVDAMGSFIFNIGVGHFSGSTLLRDLNTGNKAALPDQLLKWNRAGGIILPRLIRRGQAEGALWTFGDYGLKPGGGL